MPMPSAIIDQIVQALTKAVWDRSELTRLREPIEGVLQAGTFRHLTTQAFETFATQITSDLPQYFDAGFIQMPQVQALLVDYIVKGKAIDLGELTRLYGKRHLNPADAPDVAEQINGYLTRLRETFATDPTYAPIVLARDVQSMTAALNNLRGEMHGRFDEVVARLDMLLQEPEIKALVERKTGTHIFLSYTRANITTALMIRNALEDAGHTVWQDTTAIKTGSEWIDSIENGIDRCYALVTVVSHESQQSKWVKIEYLHAQRREKVIYPIKIDDCEIPTMMLTENMAHAHPDFEAGLRKLIGELPTPPNKTVQSSETPPDLRSLEIDYLNRLLLEHSVWQSVYTPMAGVAQIRKEQTAQKPKMVTVPCGIDAKFKRRLQQSALAAETVVETEQKEYDDILPAVDEMRQLVILGDPGAGKTTTLWTIVAYAAQRAKDDPTKPLPIFVRLGELSQAQTLQMRVADALGALAPHYETLLKQKRLMFLLDGLNEMPAANRDENIRQIKGLINYCRQHEIVVVVTCRELDYFGTLDMDLSEKILVTPLDPVRIMRFVKGYITEPADAGEKLFWLLAGEAAFNQWQRFNEAVGDLFDVFWLEDTLPAGKEWGWEWGDESGKQRYWKSWLNQRQQPRSLLQLATNPFMLYMMTQVFTEEGHLPPNRGALFKLFVEFLLFDREGLGGADAEELQTRLADLGYTMQAQGEGTSVKRDEALHYLGNEQNLYRAFSASLLTGNDEVRFAHQLLQEYFAAHKLDIEMKSGVPATTFWQGENWWQPNQWNETAVLLAGLYSDDTTLVVQWLKDANPELTARCILESGAQTPHATIESLRHDWLPRLKDFERDPKAQAREAIGRAVGVLKLDHRKGVGVIQIAGESIPDIDWVRIPAGKFWMGSNKSEDPDASDDEMPQHKVFLPEYNISRYPITYAQFAPFILDGGYQRREFWTKAGWQEKEKDGWTAPELWYNPIWNIPNHPINGVSWYECYAFTRWLDTKYQQYSDVLRSQTSALSTQSLQIRLPTEREWEKAARGTDKRIFPYGSDFNPEMGNVWGTGIGRTSAVGIFPNEALPYGAEEMSGNVWEWCWTQWRSSHQEETYHSIAGLDTHVQRGGAFQDVADGARCASRHYINSYFRLNLFGFRVVAVPIS
jgi:formylglycine-generating enzyme required for sulfatase activity